MGLIIAIFENMQGKIDSELATLVLIIAEELTFLSTVESKAANFKSSALQAIAMAFSYNAMQTF